MKLLEQLTDTLAIFPRAGNGSTAVDEVVPICKQFETHLTLNIIEKLLLFTQTITKSSQHMKAYLPKGNSLSL